MSNKFRPVYRDLTGEEQQLLSDIKTKAEELDALLARVGSGSRDGAARYEKLAMTALEECVMWSVKGVTA